MGKDTEQALPLLEDEEQSLDEVVHSSKSSRYSTLRSRWCTYSLFLYAFLLTGVVMYQNIHHDTPSVPYSPASHVIQYEDQPANPDVYMIYSEPPSPEVDAAWDDAVKPIYYAAVAQEIKLSNDDPDDTVELMDREGYLGSIGIYHSLHCMRRLYWHLNEDVYFPNRTAEKREGEIKHALHCLGVVVRDLMCLPDTTLYTFGYDPEQDPKPILKSGATRKCMKWEPFHEWALKRAPGYSPKMKAPANVLKKMWKDGKAPQEEGLPEGLHMTGTE